MKRGIGMILVCLLLVSVLFVSLVSALKFSDFLGTWFDKSQGNSENANTNPLTGWAFSWFKPKTSSGTQTTQSATIQSSTTSPTTSSIIKTSYLGCGNNCAFESVFKMDPTNDSRGYVFGGGSPFYNSMPLIETRDGWNTWKKLNLDAFDSSAGNYGGDPQIIFTGQGKLILLANLNVHGGSGNTGIYQEIAPLESSLKLMQNLVNVVPAPTPIGLLSDYGKIGIDNDKTSPYFGNIYATANSVYFENPDSQGNHNLQGFFVIKPDSNQKLVINKKKSQDIGLSTSGGAGQSITVGKGVIYIGINDAISVASSINGGQSFKEVKISDIPNCIPFTKTSQNSNTPWVGYKGPMLAFDNNKNRLYAAWANFKNCVNDPNFQDQQYAQDYDVFLSYSDDKGQTWSNPIKVNDDNSGGNQIFPSIAVDNNGIVYVAFLDHRDNQDKEQYDVYLSYSTDGGKTFSKNIRVNDQSVPNTIGRAIPGDYLDMLAVGNSKVFVSYPCVNPTLDLSRNSPNDGCISILDKPTTLGTGSGTIKSCAQTRTLTRQLNPNLCSSAETRGTVASSRQCTGSLWHRQCTIYYYYTCTKTIQTACSANAACPSGTTETKSEACIFPIIAPIVGSCIGTATSCSYFSWDNLDSDPMGACKKQQGCIWSGSYNTGKCTGYPISCSSINTIYPADVPCAAQDGCVWKSAK